jgi:hypothetical protein
MPENKTDKISEKDINNYQKEIKDYYQKVEPVYSIIARPLSYAIKGGEDIQISVFLTGLGLPDSNKLVLSWASPRIIDSSSAGNATSCIKTATSRDKEGRRTFYPLVGDEYIETVELEKNGITIFLNHGYFLLVPGLSAPFEENLSMCSVMAEKVYNNNPPTIICLKTLSNAESGDYEIDVTLTYTYKNVAKQATAKVTIHITSWWDRHQWWILTAGAIITFILVSGE